MKTKLLPALLFFCIFIDAHAQTPNWLWATAAGGQFAEQADAICTDASGNVYATGYFSTSSITFGSYTLTTSGSSSLFIVKFDPSGNVLWAQSKSGSSTINGYGIAADASGNVYVSGRFYSSTLTFASTTLTNAGGSDMFVVKLNSSGTYLWAKSAGGTGTESGAGISVDASGNVIVSGYFSSSSLTFGSTTLTNATGSSDMFTVKYDASGAVLWAKSAASAGVDYGVDNTTHATGNVIISGYFS